MFDAPFVPPEVTAVDVPEGQPDARMHRVVVVRVHAGDRRVVPSHLDAVRRADVREVGTQDPFIAEDIVGHRPPGIGDDQAIGNLEAVPTISRRSGAPARRNQQCADHGKMDEMSHAPPILLGYPR